MRRPSWYPCEPMKLLLRLSHRFLLLGLLVLLPAAARADASATRPFDVPAGEAGPSLRLFAQQAKREIVFPPLDGVRTNAVRGEYTVKAALDRLLAGTELVSFEDGKTGALVVNRPPAEAKNAPSPPAEAKTAGRADGTVVLDSFEVTGLRVTGIVNQGVIPREENGATRFFVIDRGEIDQSGATNLSELFRRSVSFDSRYGSAEQVVGAAGAFSGGLGMRVESLNFRGLGANQTLVLVNGRRLYAGEGFSGSDVSRIPLAAVERIEILPGSASAIYGGNALGGAVNIILRREFRGSEVVTYFGTSTRGGAEEFRGTVNLGWASRNGRTNGTVVLDHNWRAGLRAGERRFYREALTVITPASAGSSFDFPFKILGAFSGQPGNVYGFFAPLGIPGSPAARFAAIPANQNGTGLTAASFSSTAGQLNLGDRPGETWLLSETQVLSLTSTLEHRLRADGKLAFYAELGLARTEMPRANSNSNNFSYLMPPGVPLNPFATFAFVFWDPIDLPRSFTEQNQDVARAVAGFKGEADWLARPWNWSLDGSWEWTRTESVSGDGAFPLRTLIANGVYNPLRDLRSNPHSLSADYVRFEKDQEQTPQIGAVNLRANGEAFALPAGPARVSLGAESRWEDYRSSQSFVYGGWAALPGSGGAPGRQTNRIAVARGIRAGFLEMVAPLVAPERPRFGLQDATLNVAARLDHYDDFGSSGVRPFVSLLVSPFRGLGLRGSYSEAFLPPNQTDLSAPRITQRLNFSDSTPDPRRGNQPVGIYDQISGGNPGLKPEEARNWNYGVIVRLPRWPNFSASVDGFSIERDNTVVTMNLKQIFLAAERFYPDRIVRAQPTAADTAAGFAGQITSIDVRPINLATTSTSGVDVKLTWDFPETSAGDFRVQAAGTYTRSFRVRSAPGAAAVESVGVVTLIDNTPVKYRGNLMLNWKRDRWSAAVTGRYVHSYATIGNIQTPALGVFFNPSAVAYDGESVNPSAEFDVQLGYRFPLADAGGTGMARMLAGTEWTLGANNVFDREPPYTTDGFAYYSSFNDPRMRFVYVRIKKSF
jgi:iron complex outermembrane recepter protein